MKYIKINEIEGKIILEKIDNEKQVAWIKWYNEPVDYFPIKNECVSLYGLTFRLDDFKENE